MDVLVADERAVALAFAVATAARRRAAGTFTRERLRRPEGGASVPAVAGRTEEVDPSVLAAAQHGDDAAFVDVMRHYDRRLRIVAYHTLSDRQLMDDVLQEVTLRVYRSLPRFRGESSLGTWLCRITYHACCDAMTRATRPDCLHALVPDELADLPDPAPDPADAVATHAALAEAFAALPPEQRLAVLLVDREGYDYATTAAILDVPMGTLASRLSAARTTLRRRLRASMSLEAR
jgi:RNA polymerase sigma-70 factor, ECF subfamily